MITQCKIRNTKNTMQCGFTLVELLVVIVIVGLLSSFLFANLISARHRARDATRKADLAQIQAALEIFRSDYGSYPNPSLATQDLPVCGQPLGSETTAIYMKRFPCDPSLKDPVTGAQLPFDYAYSNNGAGYYLMACLENTGDSDKYNNDFGTPAELGLTSCPTGTVAYVVTEP